MEHIDAAPGAQAATDTRQFLTFALGDEEFGIERLEALLAETAGLPLERRLERLAEAVTGFAAGQPQGDDQTFLLVRRLPATS